jgi:hypothetical protein
VLRSRPSAHAKSARQKSLPARTRKSSSPARSR